MHRAALFLVLPLLFGPGTDALAQADGKPGSRVSFRVTRFDPADRPSPVFRVPGGAGRSEVAVPLTCIAGPFEATLRDESFLDFFEGDGKKPVLSVAIDPNQRKDLLLFFVPNDGGYRILPVHAPVSRIKGGDRFVVNATTADVSIQFGKAEPLVIAPGKPGLLAGPRGDTVVAVPVVIKQKSADGWSLVSTEYWPCDPRFRSFLFLYQSPESNHVLFHGVADRLPE